MPNFHFKPQHFEPSFIAFSLDLPKDNKAARLSLPQRKSLKKNSLTRKILPKLEAELREFLAVFAPPITYNTLGTQDFKDSLNGLEIPDDSWDCLPAEVFFGVKLNYEQDFDAILLSTPRVKSHPVKTNLRMLICSMPNPFHRFVMHTLCNYYNVVSFSKKNLD